MKTFAEYKKEKEAKLASDKNIPNPVEESKTEDDDISSAAVTKILKEEKEVKPFTQWKQEKESLVEFKEYKDAELSPEEIFEAVYDELNENGVLDEGIKSAIQNTVAKVGNAAKKTVNAGFFVADAVRSSHLAKAGGLAVAAGTATQMVQKGSSYGAAAVAGGYAGTATAILAGLATHFWYNRNRYELRFRDYLGKTTRSMVQNLYFKSFKSMIEKRDLEMTIKQSGQKIIIESKYSLPNKKPPRIILDVGYKQVAIFPENTGGSASLDRFKFDGTTIRSVTGKAIGKGQGGRYIGNEKIPNRALTYREDLAKIFLITCDLMTEIYADFADYFEGIAQKINASRNADVNVFLAVETRYALADVYVREKSEEEVAAEAEEKRRQTEEARRNNRRNAS